MMKLFVKIAVWMRSKKLDKQTFIEFQELTRAYNAEQFKLRKVKENTAQVHHGQDWVKTQETIVRLMKEQLDNYMAGKLAKMGFEPEQDKGVFVHPRTGRIYKINKPKNDNTKKNI